MALLHDREAVFAGVLLLANRMQSRYDTEVGELTLKQWLALAVVANLDRPVPSTAVVARALGTTHQNVRKLLGALADKGLLSLTPSAQDRRARQVDLTPAALDYLARHEDTGTRLLDELFTDVDPEELATCLRVLNGMSVNLTGDLLTPPQT